MVSVVVGGHYGDEGKGKMVSYLALKDKPAYIGRAGVGPNAGHTVYKDGKKYGLRMITCGFVNPNSHLLIGAGVLVDIQRFLEEVEMTGVGDRIKVDRRCAVIEQEHKDADHSANSKKIGTTGSGCGPANAARVNRVARQAKDFKELEGYIADVPQLINDAIDGGEDVLIEASQGFGLSLYYGNYPYVTSKDTSASTAAADMGVGPTRVNDVYVIFKAYMSRVGEDPYIHYLTDEEVEKSSMWTALLERAKAEGHEGTTNEMLAKHLGEVGTVTGRPRKIGSFDYDLARYSSRVNGATQICITCLDKLFPECSGVKDYDRLSEDAISHVGGIEEKLGVKATLISTGPDVFDVVDFRDGRE
ncbi:MAG: adenylosuccinate synthetase [Candidatus Altiarchaeales archaeon]|nr:adenylosuccinate synthetase [Candidatus Altiarchaeales archaeon]MBD3416673.1 adenylosuccinate synthetase [Candidatus Altiarchaeales archaeon]